MNITVLKKESVKNKRITWLHLRFTDYENGIRKSKYKSLGLYEFKSPRTKDERRHNSKVFQRTEIQVSKLKLNELETPKEEPILFFHWMNETVDSRLRIPLKRFLMFIEPDIRDKSIQEVANVKYLHRLKRLFQKDIEDKKYRGRVGHNGKVKRVLKASTYCNYWACIKASVRKAYPEYLDEFPDKIGILHHNEPVSKAHIVYSDEDLKALWETPVFDSRNYHKLKKGRIGVKEACFFSLYTGLRIVDIINMKWKDVKASEKGWYFEITQKKTNHTIKNSFPKFARELLAERKHGDNPVFSGLQGFNYQNSYRQLTYDRFKRWRNRAGVSKDKTLHTFRHTYANNLYKRCNNIYEVSKALGHKKLETTLQFYAPESKFDQNSAFIEDAYNFV